MIQDWERSGVIRLRAKWLATTMMVLLLSYPVGFSSIPAVFRVTMAVVAFVVLTFIWTRPSSPGARDSVGATEKAL